MSGIIDVGESAFLNSILQYTAAGSRHPLVLPRFLFFDDDFPKFNIGFWHFEYVFSRMEIALQLAEILHLP